MTGLARPGEAVQEREEAQEWVNLGGGRVVQESAQDLKENVCVRNVELRLRMRQESRAIL